MDNTHSTELQELEPGKDSEYNVCKNCKILNLSKAFSSTLPSWVDLADHVNHAGLPITLVLHSRSDDCILCKMIYRQGWRNWGNTGPFVLEAFPPPGWDGDQIHSGVACLYPIPTNRDSLSKFEQSTLYMKPFAGSLMDGWVACHKSSDPTGILKPQSIQIAFDYLLAKKWIRSCKEYHPNCFNFSASISISQITLIHCDSKQLVYITKATEIPPYVALSYVWEQFNNSTSSESRSNRMHNSYQILEESCSQTIRDSIIAAQQLGYEYIWIDKFCIDQLDPIRKQLQIENMNLIYQRAELTIIACAGQDEHSGLPGIGVKRTKQVRFQVGDFTITHMPPSSGSESVWNKRAWTFQEEIFSSRSLYFDNDGISFVCNQMRCSEGMGGAEHVTNQNQMDEYDIASKDKYLERFRPPWYMAQKLMSRNEKDFPSTKVRVKQFMELVYAYSVRNMTYDTDALNAFAGIQSCFEEGNNPVYHLQGIPLALGTTEKELESSELTFILNSFLTGLSWHPDDGRAHLSSRRAHFPSWSTAGWTGTKFYAKVLPDHLWIRNYVQDCSIEIENNVHHSLKQLIDVLRMFHASRSISQDSPEANAIYHRLTTPIALVLYAPTFESSLFTTTNPHQSWETAKLLGYPLQNYLGNNIKDEYMPFTYQSLIHGLVDNSLGCVLLGVVSGGFEGAILSAQILIVRWSGTDTASRIGIFQITLTHGSDEVLEQFNQLLMRKFRLV